MNFFLLIIYFCFHPSLNLQSSLNQVPLIIIDDYILDQTTYQITINSYMSTINHHLIMYLIHDVFHQN